MVEIWKGMTYQKQYYGDVLEVSTCGKIRNIITGTVYKLNICGSGYLGTVISINKHKKSFKVHKAVAETFIPNPNNLPMVNHKDGVKTNNFVENLEWCTAKYNSQHAMKYNLIKNFTYGETNISSKLKSDDIKYIRDNCIVGHKYFGYKPLAKMFGVSRNTIRDIHKNKIWKTIK